MKRSLRFKTLLVGCTAAALSMLPISSALADVPQPAVDASCHPFPNNFVVCLAICTVQNQSVKPCGLGELISCGDPLVCDVLTAVWNIIP